MKRVVCGITLTLMLVTILTLTFNIQPVKAEGTIYIRADGSIDPPTAPISTVDNVTYTLTDNITSSDDGVIVERDNIVVEGAGYTLQRTEAYCSTGIDLTGRSNVTIKNTQIKKFHCGIDLVGSSNNSISGNKITNNRDGIVVIESSKNNISRNNIVANYAYGIQLGSSAFNNVIQGNKIVEHGFGIALYGARAGANVMSGNNITNNKWGILVDESSYNIISGNNITNGHGIVLGRCSNNNIVGNMFTNSGLTLDLPSVTSPLPYGNIVDGNFVNGKPLVYLEGVSDYTVDDAGQVILIYCDNIQVQNLDLCHTHYGLALWRTSNGKIINNNVTNNFCGIYLYGSSSNSIAENNLTNNEYGVSLWNSSNNEIYHNNFINNTKHTHDYSWDYHSIPPSVCIWDEDYPSGGNYWSDYKGDDNCGGPDQDQPGSDGIGDTPYIIDGNNEDNYPLMKPWCSHELAVPYEAQGNAWWCWAASTAMILRYYGKPVHVWDIGKTKPLFFDVSEIESYIQEKYPGEFETKIGSYSSISETTRVDIEGNLSKGHPVILHVDPPGIGTHLVVVTSFNSSGFFINDPSGALFAALGRSAGYPYIHEFASWTELQPLIFIELLSNHVFLVVEGTPSPLDATLFTTNGEGVRTIHDSDNEIGVCIDYGGWQWFRGLYWRSIGWHPVVWDSKDTLEYYYEIFNHKDQEARFDFYFQIKGKDESVYYEKNILNISVSAFNYKLAWEIGIDLNDYLVEGQQYIVTAKISHHGFSEIIDSITLPPIYYGVKSIMFTIECPVRMLVTDPDGLRVGFDSESNLTVCEIPNALYYYGNKSEPNLMSIPNQKDGNYTVTVFGIETGTYNLTCSTLDDTDFLSIERFIDIPIAEDKSHTYIIPEFPSFLILPLFMVATLLAVIIYSKKTDKLQKLRQPHRS